MAIRPTTRISAIAIVLLLVLTPTDESPGQTEPAGPDTPVDRLIIALPPIVPESNRIWTGSSIMLTALDGVVETLIGNDKQTGLATPGLAESWDVSDDFRSWTFHLRQGVQFHDDWGEFTAQDVVLTHTLLTREDSIASHREDWVEAEIEVVDDYTVIFHFENPKIPAVAESFFSKRDGDFVILSNAQWEAEGADGLDREPAGTGPYEYGGRRPGEAVFHVRRADEHWSGIVPEYKEFELRWVPEATTRFALLLTGEVHAADIPRDLHEAATEVGFEILASQTSNMQTFIFLGGQHYIPGAPTFDPDIPWTDVRVRQALNMAINRDELISVLYRGNATPVYRTGWNPGNEGWNPEWENQFDEMYGYDPERARELIAEAGYEPGEIQPVIHSFPLSGNPEFPVLVEALQLYFSEIGVDLQIQDTEFGVPFGLGRKKNLGFAMYPNRNAPIRPTQSALRYYFSEGVHQAYNSPYVDERVPQVTGSIDVEERDRLLIEIGDHLFENYADIPLFELRYELVIAPNFIGEWTIPGMGAVPTHFETITAP